jgi:tetratricopeptide (TPR) repeat protein
LRRAGHHGLLVAAVAARDVDTALAHGWAAFQEESSDNDQRAEMLINLGEVSLHAREYRAALGACLSALELSDLPRLRLPATGTAAIAAAHLGERRVVEFLIRESKRLLTRSGQPFENARMLAELAEACAVLGYPEAIEYARCADEIAQRGNFNEVAVRVEMLRIGSLAVDQSQPVRHARSPEQVDARRPGTGSRVDAGAAESQLALRLPRSPRARAVLRTLETLVLACTSGRDNAIAG